MILAQYVRSRFGLSTLLAVKKERKQNYLLTCPVISLAVLPFRDGVQSTPCGYIIQVSCLSGFMKTNEKENQEQEAAK